MFGFKKYNPDTFCILPWMHIETRPDGQLAPCCVSSKTIKRNDGRNFYLYRDKIEDAWKSDYIKKLRQDLSEGKKIDACSMCWKLESSGAESIRQKENKKYKEQFNYQRIRATKQPIDIEFKLGNICNLKCRTCSASNSSKWTEEEKAILGFDGIPREDEDLKKMDLDESRKLMMSWHDENPNFWQTIEKWLPKTQNLLFTGGEPFLNKSHQEIIRLSIKKGYAKKQTIEYITNGTIYPGDFIQQVYKNFIYTNITFSCDAVGEQYSYIRHGGNWQQTLQNIEKFRDTQEKAFFCVCLTVSNYNIFYLPEYLTFWQSQGLRVSLNIATESNFFSIRCLPHTIKEKIWQKFESYGWDAFAKNTMNPEDFRHLADFMMDVDNSSQWPRFLQHIKQHDKYRKENFPSIFPEYYTLIKKNLDHMIKERPYLSNKIQL